MCLERCDLNGLPTSWTLYISSSGQFSDESLSLLQHRKFLTDQWFEGTRERQAGGAYSFDMGFEFEFRGTPEGNVPLSLSRELRNPHVDGGY